MKRRNVTIFMILMLIGLTACQKTGESEKDDSVILEESAGGQEGEKDISKADAETGGQENVFLLEALTGSPEYQASAEWDAFYWGYDTDGTILAQAGNEPIEEEDEYEAYSCYSQEMEEKVDEICEKYGLSKLNGFQISNNYEELCSKAGVGAFCKELSENVKHTFLTGYLYADGSFKIEGEVTLAGSSIYEVTYQMIRSVKGSLNNLLYDDLTEYRTREYETENGEIVLIASSEDQNPLILVIREKSFLEVRVIADFMEESDINDEMLEELADAFDFTTIP